MRWPALLLLLLAVTACEENPYATTSDEELHTKARALALPARYDLYAKVLQSRIPNRPILADDVAALGPPAWRYVVGRALGGGSTELSQALPVLFAFDRRCSSGELELLRAHADSVASADTARALKGSIDSLCGADLPAGD